MKKRIKIALKPITTRAQAEQVMADLATAENHKRRIIAERDDEVLCLNDRYATNINECESAVEEATLRLKDWAEVHPEEFPKGRKSLDLAAGIIGFRTGTPKLKLLSKAWNWEKVLAAALSTFPNFIRSKPELDKEALIAQRDEIADLLPLIGVKVDQDESFYIEPNLTDTDCNQTAV
jgi:phage host-nuclease inhibitor protein Gam